MAPTDTRPPIPAVLLAGGLARRMGGGDKPLRAIGGVSILARAIAALEPQCDRLVLNANGDTTRFAAFGLPVIEDSVPGFAGPLAGILAALDWAATHRPDARFMVSAPADCPFLPEDLVARLDAARAASKAPIAVASSGGEMHPVIALWDVTLRDDLRRALVDDDLRRVRGFITRYPFVTAEWSMTPHDPFFNANTLEDLAVAERLARSVCPPAAGIIREGE
ncbi:MAG: molybdenum cofactor guanylyltransferase MobA [Tardiphaga sp.]|nr:molybdenum cofactor guanylyltransferase MobA [Tardiphaga sp.]